MHITALIVAAGRGARMGDAANGPKQYAQLNGQTLLALTIAAFLHHPKVSAISVVIHRDDRSLYDHALADLPNLATTSDLHKISAPVTGGHTRQASVHAGLRALASQSPPPDCVLIHDAARPFVTATDIGNVLDAIRPGHGAIAACPVVDTIKQAAAPEDDRANVTAPLIARTVPRAGLWRALTPQGFMLADILGAHEAAASATAETFTDDASIAEAAGIAVSLVSGDPGNVKLTYPQDLADAEARLARSSR